MAPREAMDSVRESVTIELLPLALEILRGEGSDAERLSARFELVIRSYLRDVDSERFTRPYPVSIARGSGAAPATALDLSLDNLVWDAFKQEAKRQGVSTDELGGHAIFYFNADLESGRLTERILASPHFGEGEGGGPAD